MNVDGIIRHDLSSCGLWKELGGGWGRPQDVYLFDGGGAALPAARQRPTDGPHRHSPADGALALSEAVVAGGG